VQELQDQEDWDRELEKNTKMIEHISITTDTDEHLASPTFRYQQKSIEQMQEK
jgi:hypothetical protein